MVGGARDLASFDVGVNFIGVGTDFTRAAPYEYAVAARVGACRGTVPIAAGDAVEDHAIGNVSVGVELMDLRVRAIDLDSGGEARHLRMAQGESGCRLAREE